MADGLVSSILLALNSIIQPEMRMVLSSRRELQNLSSSFTGIKAALHDAENRQRTDEVLRDWLEKLKDVAYDVDDLLDEWKAEALKFEIERSIIPTCGNQVCNVSLRRLCFKEHADELVFHLKLGIKMGRRVKTIRERLDVICNERSRFLLEESPTSKGEVYERRTSSLIDELEIIGRTSDKRRIIPWLISQRSSSVDENLSVISIVGLCGVGKTALAQLVYNDERVKQHYKKRIWVHVSNTFNEIRICKAIIEAVNGRVAPSYSEWEMVQNYLRNILEGEKFLLVLDDVWNEDQEKWDNLMFPLKGGANESRILITTRNESVTKTVRTSKLHHLEPLFDSDCWSLFHRIAFGGVNTEEHTEMEEIGRQIAQKCNGVPLIIKRVGTAMRFRRTRREWELVLDRETGDLSPVQRAITLNLQLSYDNMLSHLKQCFAFCFVFPRDHVIEKDTLIKLWMAQGFLLSEGNAEMENTGDRYFYDLLGQSLFEDAATDYPGNVSHFKMKDIVHDLFKIVMSECCPMNLEILNSVPMNVRHISFKYDDVLSSFLESLCKAKNLRTLIFIGWSRSTQLSPDFFENFRCLRALDLSGMKISKLPNSFKHLKRLRYLNLSATGIKKLPQSLSEMYLLQTLRLNECYELCKLPEDMWKLTKLRHLEIKGTWKLRGLPHGIGRLTSLRTLSRFIVGDATGSGIAELESLKFLQGELAIMHLERVSSEDEARQANLMTKKNIRVLELYCSDDFQSASSDHEASRIDGVFEGLQPHKNLQELKICHYSGLKFPSWIGDSIFTGLVDVSLSYCRKCSKLPALGTLPSLKYLTIEGMPEVKSIGLEFYENGNCATGITFPKLEKLVLDNMVNLETLFCQEMPSLLELQIVRCHRLNAFRVSIHHRLWYLVIAYSMNMPRHMCWPCSESIECLLLRGSKKFKMGFLPNLKYLMIENVLDLSHVQGLENLHQLHTLHIKQCKARHLTRKFKTLKNLRQLKIVGCLHLHNRCQRNAGEDWHLISHIPNIWIDNQEIQREGLEVSR